MNKVVTIISVCCLSLLAVVSGAEAGQLLATAMADRTTINVGDQIRLILELEATPDVEVILPTEVDFGDLELLGKKVLDPKRMETGTVVQKIVYTLTVFKTGDTAISPIKVAYIDGDKELSTLSQRIDIRVESVLKGDLKGKDIRPLKGQVSLGRGVVSNLLRALLALLCLVGAVYLFLYIKRRRDELAQNLKAPERPPHEVAYEALNKLKESPLLKDGKVKEYYIELSWIVRFYLEKRFKVSMTDRTTDEIFHIMRENKIEHSTVELVHDFLVSSDLVKFAKWTPLPIGITNDTNRGYKIVDTTKIEEVAEEPEDAKSTEKKVYIGVKKRRNVKRGKGQNK
ncbi:MAG: hypothetical protein HQ593_01200 [Candidatus Omnitrophica bacterium]|nr:hypothetical protein [Candidatus Omnitrophota bacterium]